MKHLRKTLFVGDTQIAWNSLRFMFQVPYIFYDECYGKWKEDFVYSNDIALLVEDSQEQGYYIERETSDFMSGRKVTHEPVTLPEHLENVIALIVGRGRPQNRDETTWALDVAWRIGHGLCVYPDPELESVIDTLYQRLLARSYRVICHTYADVLEEDLPVNRQTWLEHLKEGLANGRASMEAARC